ncbi:MAG: type II toxin-antitoxin system prevent-host-death family antitoxin [Acidobacteriia bacterium]|nr:type II toxin-antitoxin system prevent-host-death family antitoxin [Terriglobia bacterium]
MIRHKPDRYYNVAMRSTSIRELHIHTSELVREAEAGSIIVIERRSEPVAQLQSLTRRPQISDANRSCILAEMRESRASILAESCMAMPVTISNVDRLLTQRRDRC